MTEAEWLASTDPGPMLDFVRGKATDRKLRLFAVACCRRVWYLLDEHSRRAVDVVERDAEGPRKIETWAVAEMDKCLGDQRASRAMRIGVPPWWLVVTTLLAGQTENAKRLVAWIAWSLHARANDTHAALRASPGDEVRAARAAWVTAQVAKTQEQTSQCHLLREMLGNPFRPRSINPSCQTPQVARLAQGIYDNRAFDRLPVLADALEDAGCTDAAILGHCREPREHVRGCWLVDMLTGRS
jgi:hypothetical protein